MRTLSRVVLLGALSAVAAAPTASAASSLSMTVSPNKRGTLTLGAPTTFTAQFASPERVSLTDGSIRLKAIVAKLPDQLVFNPLPFAACDAVQFVASRTCPASTKLGSATIIADGGPEIGEVPATAVLYFGSGYSVLAHIQASRPAVIDEGVVGSLQSSASTTDSSRGFGLQMYIPVSPQVQMPLDNVFPVVKKFDATIKPMTKKVKVDGVKGKYTMPVAGLGPCSTLNFRVGALYTNAAGVDTIAQDVADDKQACKK
jgi:hypothetical protein